MKQARTAVAVLLVLAAPPATFAESPPSFQPQTKNVLGTAKAGVPITFTRVFTQEAGELAIGVTQEHYVNMVPNWLMIAKAALADPHTPVAYIDITWADQLLRVTCFLDRADSDLPRGRFHVTMKATKGTTGSTPVGTVVGISIGRAFRQAGLWVIMADVTWTPGIFPDVLPTSFTMAHQLVPGLWKTDQPGRVFCQHTFTSVQPPDGSPPIVYATQEGIPVR